MTTSIIVTSVQRPNAALRALAEGAAQAGHDFIVIGDARSPAVFVLEGCRFLSIDQQLKTGLRLARLAPLGHYSRKNIGYLLAISEGAGLIIETDDDNFPRPAFFAERSRSLCAPLSSGRGWVNVYRYFSEANIWPRGLPLDKAGVNPTPFESLAVAEVDCPIQQGLADENPDVDAIYRLVLPLPQTFRNDRRLALGKGSWCPFNSQNTAWWPAAFPLLYLPTHCSFRMTDIWRSFVAQRIAWENGWSVLFHGPTVRQERNEHDLMRDFADEVPGYLHNERICRILEELPIEGGAEAIAKGLRRCYEALVRCGMVGAAELPLLDAWIADLDGLNDETRG